MANKRRYIGKKRKNYGNLAKAHEAKRQKREVQILENQDINKDALIQPKEKLSKSTVEIHQKLQASETANPIKENQITCEIGADKILHIQNDASLSPTQDPGVGNLAIEENISLDNKLQGRRIIDFMFFMDQIKSLNNHNAAFGCSIGNLHFLKEVQSGLHSVFLMKCNMCNIELKLQTSDRSNSGMDANHGAVMGAIMIGCGQSNLDEFLASVDLTLMGQTRQKKI